MFASTPRAAGSLLAFGSVLIVVGAMQFVTHKNAGKTQLLDLLAAILASVAGILSAVLGDYPTLYASVVVTVSQFGKWQLQFSRTDVLAASLASFVHVVANGTNDASRAVAIVFIGLICIYNVYCTLQAWNNTQNALQICLYVFVLGLMAWTADKSMLFAVTAIIIIHVFMWACIIFLEKHAKIFILFAAAMTGLTVFRTVHVVCPENSYATLLHVCASVKIARCVYIALWAFLILLDSRLYGRI